MEEKKAVWTDQATVALQQLHERGKKPKDISDYLSSSTDWEPIQQSNVETKLAIYQQSMEMESLALLTKHNS